MGPPAWVGIGRSGFENGPCSRTAWVGVTLSKACEGEQRKGGEEQDGSSHRAASWNNRERRNPSPIRVATFNGKSDRLGDAAH